MLVRMLPATRRRTARRLYDVVLSVPVSIKIAGIMMLPVLILGLSLNYWMTTGLSDWLSYLLTDVRVNAAMEAGRRSVTLVTVLAAAASILLAALLTHWLTLPLRELRTMAQQVAGGELNARAPVYSNDEIGEVASAINTMTNHLVQAQSSLTRSNRRLSAINRVIMAAGQDQEIHDVLYTILGAVLDVLNLDMGWVYLRDPDRDRFHLASWRNVPSELGDYLLHAPERELCLCQRMLQSGALSGSVQRCDCARLAAHFPPARQAAHFSLPIEAGDLRLGVVNLLSFDAQPLSEDDLDLLTAIGSQISEVVSKTWLRMKLDEKEKVRLYLLQSLVEAQEEERNRLARELHDGAGQMLTSLLVRLKTLENRAAEDAVRQGLSTTQDMVSETIEQVRELSYRLRPAALEEFGLAVALRTLVAETLDEAGVEASCRTVLDGAVLPAGVEVALYRIAQEAITNVLRHAQAKQVHVELIRQGDVVSLRIRDDGRGFEVHQAPEDGGKRHLGLVSMRERAEMISGTLYVDSAPGAGTTLRVDVRVDAQKGGR